MEGWTAAPLSAGTSEQKNKQHGVTDYPLKQGIFIGFSIVTTCLLASMAVYFFFRRDLQLVYIDTTFAAALLANLLIYRFSKRLLPALRIGVSLGALTIICLTFFGSQQGSQGVFLWFFTLPLGSIFLLGKKEGLFWTVFYFLILVEVMWHNDRILDTYLIRFLVAYVIVALFAFIYEAKRESMQKRLSRTNRELTTAKETMEKASERLSRYLSPQIRDALFSGDTRARIESRRRHLTFFFSDIVDFTGTTEHLEPEVLTGLLTSYLGEMSEIALKYGATIDKFIGDGIMAFFGAPQSLGKKEDALRCVRMALEMQNRIAELQEFWAEQGVQRPLQVRMGINSGYCTVGNFGTNDRMDFTAIGSQVNLASRLENQAGSDRIFLSRTTYLLVRDLIHCEEIGTVQPKGMLSPVQVYEAVDLQENIREGKELIRQEGKGYLIRINPSGLTLDSRLHLVHFLEKQLKALRQHSP